MSIKNSADLNSENTLSITGQTIPKSLTPTILGGILADIIDSMFNRSDDSILPAPISLTKAALATKIGSSLLVDKQWIKITDRNDGFPLFVCAQLTNQISPFGIRVISGTPSAVIMDYVGGADGETNPFLAFIDVDGKFNLTKQIIIADGTQLANAVLTSDVDGKSAWKLAANYQSLILNPAGMTGATEKMMGLAGAITPGKSGVVKIDISGQYTSDDIAGATSLRIRTGTGAAPGNGDGTTGTSQQSITPISASATAQNSFSMNAIVALTPGTPYWIDMSCINTATGAVQLFNVSISALEQ